MQLKSSDKYWEEVAPQWATNCEYRIKPEPVQIWVVLVGSAIYGAYRNKEDAQKNAACKKFYYESLDVRVVEMVEVV